ncbi:MAG: tRNA (adenosine(37)-N6)-dimethylallyltransferase MiaA [Rhodobacterales bacterium]|nr:MAG: tRNA (adenosine(37)-N6)-dimethylallyltransferase MiaA [Rhodobacterales bacterium]
MPLSDLIHDLDPHRPVLIAGPTASGKSSLALAIAQAQGGVVVNADALQVFEGWPILSAQPSPEERARAPHALYGHLPYHAETSVGDWLRDLAPILAGDQRPIIVGGTGLYLTALTEGLAEIPGVPGDVRAAGDALSLEDLRAQVDPATLAGLDQLNRARVQRAWEVERATGTPLRVWQARTPPPLLPLGHAQPIVLDAPKEWLTPRIACRFDQMLTQGALAEAQAMAPHWDPALQSSRTIGAREMIALSRGEMPQDQAREAVVIASRQYAKRQRTWFRARMRAWHKIMAQTLERAG